MCCKISFIEIPDSVSIIPFVLSKYKILFNLEVITVQFFCKELSPYDLPKPLAINFPLVMFFN